MPYIVLIKSRHFKNGLGLSVSSATVAVVERGAAEVGVSAVPLPLVDQLQVSHLAEVVGASGIVSATVYDDRIGGESMSLVENGIIWLDELTNCPNVFN